MDFYNLVFKRQSDRAFKDMPVEPEKIKKILECARMAPSACNAQPWKFIVIDDPVLKNSVADALYSKVLSMNHFTKQAPVHIAIIEEKANFTSKAGSVVKRKHFPLIDIGITAEHICLAAADLGLGSCIIGWFDEKRVQKLLQVPSGRRIPLVILLGYPSGKTRTKNRKDLEEIVSYNRY